MKSNVEYLINILITYYYYVLAKEVAEIYNLIHNIVELLKENNYINVSFEINYNTLTINLTNNNCENNKISILYIIGDIFCFANFKNPDIIYLNKEEISCVFRIMNYIDNHRTEIDEICYRLCGKHREFEFNKNINNNKI